MSVVERPVEPPPRDQRFLLTDVSWDFYEYVLRELDERPVKVTFDRGSLELMAPSYRHEISGRTLGLLVEVLGEEFDVPLKCAGSTTFRRRDLDRGLEPDNCFYIQNVQRILGKTQIDLRRDPPPDLAIEVDVTRSSLDRMAIYATLGVPEVWRLSGDSLIVYVLGADAEYEQRTASPTFPHVPPEELVRFVILGPEQDDVSLRRQFRTWLHREILSTLQADAPGDATDSGSDG